MIYFTQICLMGKIFLMVPKISTLRLLNSLQLFVRLGKNDKKTKRHGAKLQNTFKVILGNKFDYQKFNNLSIS